MHYEELQPISRLDAATELGSSDWERISVALVRLALNDPDPEWLQETLLRYIDHQHYWVRGVAAMCLGHVARLHRQLDLDRCLPAIRRLQKDPNSDTRSHANDALDDIERYILRHQQD